MTDAGRAYSWRQIPHLAQRTLWSLRKPVPDAEGERWVLSLIISMLTAVAATAVSYALQQTGSAAR